MSQSCYGNESNNVITDQRSVAPFSGDIDQSSHVENNQLVLYGEDAMPNQSQPPSSRQQCPSIGAFTVQCASCFKWRLMPSMEKYEEIRERLLEDPFFCETACEWKPDMSCEVPADISQDGTRIWAIDKPNIARPPAGWQRLLRIRAEGGTKFADVYYVSPSGKKLRSNVEVQKYLDENPEYVRAGVKLSQFSFQIPKPLEENYVRKRPVRAMESNDNTSTPIATEANPVAWISPGDRKPSQLDDNQDMPGPGGSGLYDQSSKRTRVSEPSASGSNPDLADR